MARQEQQQHHQQMRAPASPPPEQQQQMQLQYSSRNSKRSSSRNRRPSSHQQQQHGKPAKSNPPTPANARGSASGQRGCPTPTLLWKLFDCSSTTAAVGAATSTSAGSSRTTTTTATTTATTTTTHPSFRAMVFSCRAIESLEKGCFSSLSDGTLGTFFGVVLDLARPSEPWCFPAGS